MAPGPRKSPLSQLLEDRLSQLYQEADVFLAQSRDQARREFSDQMNQAVRRLRLAPDARELGATLLDAAAQSATGVALFRIVDKLAKPERIRGVPEPTAEAFATLVIPLGSAAALASAVESRDPVTALTAPGEVSPELFKLLDHSTNGRVSLYPVVVRERVLALLYAWGGVQGPAIELLTQVAAAIWNAMPEAAAPVAAAPNPGLVRITPAPAAGLAPAVAVAASSAPVAGPLPSAAVSATPAASVTVSAIPAALAGDSAAPATASSAIPTPVPPPAPAPVSATAWDTLPAEAQQIHLRAQRFARVQVAEMRLYEADAVQAGRAQRNLYEALRKSIDGARDTFRNTFFSCASMVDYLDLELARTLANDNPDLLGKAYPGPLLR